MIQHVPANFDPATQPTVDVVDAYDDGHRAYCDWLRRSLGADIRIRVFDDPQAWFAQVSPTDLPDVIVCGNRFRAGGAADFIADLRRREVLLPVHVYTGGLVEKAIEAAASIHTKPEGKGLILAIKRSLGR